MDCQTGYRNSMRIEVSVMELSLVKNNKTRIKVSLKELQNDEWLKTILSTMKPYKESSRYKYF